MTCLARRCTGTLLVVVSSWGVFATPLSAAITLVPGATVAARSTTGDTFTSGAIDTTGATLIVIAKSCVSASSIAPTDSKSNTYTALTASDDGTGLHQLYYLYAPTVGSGHTFTIGAGVNYCAISVAAFAGALTSPFDQQSGATTGGATTLAAGSITPGATNELVVAGLSYLPGSGLTIGSGFTITNTLDSVGGQSFGVSLAYLIQTTATAANPAWSWTTSAAASARIASFKAAPTTATSALSLLGVGR